MTGTTTVVSPPGLSGEPTIIIPRITNPAIFEAMMEAFLENLLQRVHGGDPFKDTAAMQTVSLLATQIVKSYPDFEKNPGVVLDKLAKAGASFYGRTSDNQEFELRSRDDVQKFAETARKHNSKDHAPRELSFQGSFLVCVRDQNGAPGCCVRLQALHPPPK